MRQIYHTGWAPVLWVFRTQNRSFHAYLRPCSDKIYNFRERVEKGRELGLVPISHQAFLHHMATLQHSDGIWQACDRRKPKTAIALTESPPSIFIIRGFAEWLENALQNSWITYHPLQFANTAVRVACGSRKIGTLDADFGCPMLSPTAFLFSDVELTTGRLGTLRHLPLLVIWSISYVWRLTRHMRFRLCYWKFH